jgi:hypothetical protein
MRRLYRQIALRAVFSLLIKLPNANHAIVAPRNQYMASCGAAITQQSVLNRVG